MCALRNEIKKTIDLKDLWEVVGPETTHISIQDLSELFFGSNDGPDSKAALVRAIVENRLYFKIRPEGVEAVPAEKVEQEEIRRREREARRKRQVSNPVFGVSVQTEN